MTLDGRKRLRVISAGTSPYRHVKSVALTLLAVMSMNGCEQPLERWYADEHVERGAALYRIFCANCHGAELEGAADWRIPVSTGIFPPPPLDGSAHTWHHDKTLLLQIIEQGGKPMGGVMPAFRDSLSTDERIAVLAFVQSHWSDPVYRTWVSRSENTTR